MAYIQQNSPFKKSSCGCKTSCGCGSPAKKGDAPSRKKSKGYYNEANPTGTGAAAGGGMSQKGVNKYKADNPGSKLQTAVTKPPSELKRGSKDAKRRKSFCARMSGMPGPMKDEKGRPTRKALSLRKWNC